MELKLEKNEFNLRFNKLLKGLIEGDDLQFFTVDKVSGTVSFMLGDWNVELHNSGRWEIG